MNQQIRYAVLEKAFQGFKPNPAYEKFVTKNKDWFDVYALFISVKEKYGFGQWTEWPEDIKQRKPDAIQKYTKELVFPQITIISKSNGTLEYIAHYLAALGSYRFFYIILLIYRYVKYQNLSWVSIKSMAELNIWTKYYMTYFLDDLVDFWYYAYKEQVDIDFNEDEKTKTNIIEFTNSFESMIDIKFKG